MMNAHQRAELRRIELDLLDFAYRFEHAVAHPSATDARWPRQAAILMAEKIHDALPGTHFAVDISDHLYDVTQPDSDPIGGFRDCAESIVHYLIGATEKVLRCEDEHECCGVPDCDAVTPLSGVLVWPGDIGGSAYLSVYAPCWICGHGDHTLMPATYARDELLANGARWVDMPDHGKGPWSAVELVAARILVRDSRRFDRELRAALDSWKAAQ